MQYVHFDQAATEYEDVAWCIDLERIQTFVSLQKCYQPTSAYLIYL